MKEGIRKTIGICLIIIVAVVFIGAVLQEEFQEFGSFPNRGISNSAPRSIEGISDNESIGQRFLEETPDEVGGTNVITDILWDYRGYDTLGEATVLFAAVTGVALIFRAMKEEEE